MTAPTPFELNNCLTEPHFVWSVIFFGSCVIYWFLPWFVNSAKHLIILDYHYELFESINCAFGWRDVAYKQLRDKNNDRKLMSHSSKCEENIPRTLHVAIQVLHGHFFVIYVHDKFWHEISTSEFHWKCYNSQFRPKIILIYEHQWILSYKRSTDIRTNIESFHFEKNALDERKKN